MKANIPETKQKRIVIVGGGFGGLKLARSLSGKDWQVVLIDKNNYHQFQPLFYQVATAGLEPSTISFPFRKVFHKSPNIHIRMAEVLAVEIQENYIQSTIGRINYDFLVLAIGTDTNFFDNKAIQEKAMPMKSVSEALAIRNRILENYEKAISSEDPGIREALMNIVVVGGGPTGVEVSGTLAEMKRYILPKDFPELDFNQMQIHLLEAGDRLLNGMSEISGIKSKDYLERLGVKVSIGVAVNAYDGSLVSLANGETLRSDTLIWAAGVIGNKLNGLPKETMIRGNRIRVDRFNKVEGLHNVFAVGDIAYMTEENYPNAHPQVAQVAIQQAENLGKNLERERMGKPMKEFRYKNLGSMATVGRNLAVVDLPRFHFQGFIAWLAWMFVHLMSIVGVKNRIFVFINWAWNYVTYDQSLRLIIRIKKDK